MVLYLDASLNAGLEYSSPYRIRPLQIGSGIQLGYHKSCNLQLFKTAYDRYIYNKKEADSLTLK